jgi:LysM repeat protein
MAVTLPTTHTVKKNDCLWALAKTYYGKGSLFTRIAKANKIDEPYTIYVGQKLTIPDENGNTGSGGGNTSTDMTKAEVTSFGLMSTSETENELFAMWNWDKESITESYKYVWSYYKEVKVGSKTEVKEFLESVSSNSVDKDYYATSRF